MGADDFDPYKNASSAWWSVPPDEQCWHHACQQRRKGHKWCAHHESTYAGDIERATAWLYANGGKVGESK